ncbi:MAG: hypothetical protein KIC76_03325 [Firmicutes bacterium]|nr:hypothetical protein [Bacillota bacterium]
MTDEELKNIEQTTSLLVENGFVIKNTDSFIRAIDNTNLEDIINKLNVLSASASEGINIGDFVNKITERLNSIEGLTNSDPYFKSSMGAKDFQTLVASMKDKFALSKNCTRALEILNERKENLKDVNKRIIELKADNTLDDVTRTSETIKLSVALNHAKNATKEAEKFYDEQKKLYDESLKTFDVVEYKNELLKSINALDDSFRKLSMEPTTMDKMASLIRDTRDEIVVFGFEAQKSQREFDELCKKFGLEKTNQKIEVKKEDRTPEEVNETRDNSTSQTIEPEKTTETVNITTVEELAKEMKLLNSHLEISTDEKGFIESIIYDGESKLVLPKGFSYDKVLGINNKVDDKTPYISLPVKVKEKIKTADEPSKPGEVVEPTKSSKETRKVEPGKKYKVKKIRRAVVAPYVKSVLGFTGLGVVLGIAAGVGVSPLIPIAAVGAGIGVIGQKIYNKMAANGMVDKENQDKRENDPNFEEDVWGLAAIDALITKGKNLFKNLKQAKERKKEGQQIEQPVETPVEPEPVANEQKEETLDTPSESQNFEEVFNQRINEIFGEPEQAPVLPNISGEVYPLEQESKGGR